MGSSAKMAAMSVALQVRAKVGLRSPGTEGFVIGLLSFGGA